MKINNNYNKFIQSLKQTQNKGVTKKADQTVSGTTKKSVEINFSEEAKKLSELSEQEAHTQRIDEIKNKIENKTYEIDPEGITNGIVQTMKNQKGIE